MIQVQSLNHTFKIGKKGKEKKIEVLKDIDFEIQQGEIVSIVGKSGSGKSTLLQVIAGFMKPDSGSIKVNNTEIAQFNEKQSAAFRLSHFGFIFQNFQLLPNQNVFENVELPLKIKGVQAPIRKIMADKILSKVGLLEFADHYPNELSGGQQQRVSIARAMITNPPIILADEPTGSLDSQTEKEILELILKLNQTENITFMIITHDEEVAQIAHRKLRMHDGQLLGEKNYVI
ncbi:ABC transporter ATP-binding protein [Ureibacillus massiliensis 4400831 = CIP 108448 = CCUG 49529]|uniref:ABC transporter ATP-binding protein n=1 Tax=Ureibacillus massiliensis 4400831 = CIP 108448 = CCUG 49529 TaxID=1211035 RepID=A0A0A3JA00_9BACL|nr:ABC transporter ATP-binding protein [Ureibacillus massiliensis]KGR92028.1 ABC transporter ATP-binding protein [Ureibacillus massiliensis 4400831 = CIP 108448 = CCUG 49529]